MILIVSVRVDNDLHIRPCGQLTLLKDVSHEYGKSHHYHRSNV
jgi:hypothetical protein